MMGSSSQNSKKLIALESVATEIEASLAVSALKECGIHAELTGALTALNRCEAPGRVNVVVRESDVVGAQTALREFRKNQSEIDWSEVDVGEME